MKNKCDVEKSEKIREAVEKIRGKIIEDEIDPEIAVSAMMAITALCYLANGHRKSEILEDIGRCIDHYIDMQYGEDK